jgi:hypothetical protein
VRILISFAAGAIGGVLAVEAKDRWQRRRFMRQLTKAMSEEIDRPAEASATEAFVVNVSDHLRESRT